MFLLLYLFDVGVFDVLFVCFLLFDIKRVIGYILNRRGVLYNGGCRRQPES